MIARIHFHAKVSLFLLSCCLHICLGAQSPIDLSEFQTNDDVIVECVAAEPLVIDPVAMAFDEHQRMWVAENRGYPQTIEGGNAGTIALLQDLDGDGYYEKRSTFASHLNYPNGVLPWENGVIVTDAPDVLFMKDTDGDGICDIRQVLLTGFDTSRSTQLRVNDPTLGPDGWIYLAGGLSGGRVKAPWQKEEYTVDMRRHDLRFHPYDWRLKPTTGKSQFGLDFDRFGNRFICMNRIQVQQIMTEDTTWGANPHFHFNKTVENLPEERLDDLLKGYNAGARIYPLTQHLTTADSHAGTFTAACAVTIYESNGLPERYFGHVFSCDPTGNLIHFDELIPKGPSFAAHRENTRTEFVASTDRWFRPVFLTTGPDGALYVCDMRRKTIEHPDYLPQEVRKRTDFESGKDMGRIYRIQAKETFERQIIDFKTNDFYPAVSEMESAVKAKNQWAKETKFREIVKGLNDEKMGKAVLLEIEDNHTLALHEDGYMWLLFRENAHLIDESDKCWTTPNNSTNTSINIQLTQSEYDAAMKASSRKFGFIETEPDSEFPKLTNFEIIFYNSHFPFIPREPNPHLSDNLGYLFQLGMASRFWDHPLRSVFLGRLLVQHCDSEWIRAACFNASSGYNRDILKEIYRFPHADDDITDHLKASFAIFNKVGALTSVEDLSRMAVLDGSHSNELISDLIQRKPASGFGLRLSANDLNRRKFFEQYDQSASSAILFAALLLGMDGSGKLPAANPDLPWLGWGSPEQAAAWPSVRQRLEEYPMEHLNDEEISVLQRFRVLAGMDRWVWNLHQAVDLHDNALLDLVLNAATSNQGKEIIEAALDPTIWNRLPHDARNRFIQSACSDRVHADLVIQALEDSVIPPGVLNVNLRNQWKRQLTDAQQQRLEHILGKQASPDAAASYQRYKPAAKLEGNPAIGKVLFTTMCSSCHRLDQEGYALGPDLFGIRNQAKESILLHIVDPNREIASGFEGVEWTTETEEAYVGLLSFENMDQLTLKLPNGIERTFQRNEGGFLRNLPFSFMPEGIIDALSLQQVADLLSYLRGE
jgi:putative membrane-bound dehydrogenase-like protein